jgi:hypothetical protein
MSFLLRFKLFLDEFEQKNFYRVIAAVIVFLILFFGFLLHLHSNKISFLQKELKRVNRDRIRARELLEQHNLVEEQKAVVDKVLSEEKSFKILEFANNIMQTTGLQRKLAKPLELSEPQDLGNNYNELKIEMNLSGMSMQELVDLLYNKIQNNNKIYTKELGITKSSQSPTLDVTLVIATLVRKT